MAASVSSTIVCTSRRLGPVEITKKSNSGVSGRRSRTTTSCPLLSAAVLAARQARCRAVGSSGRGVTGATDAPVEVGTEDGMAMLLK